MAETTAEAAAAAAAAKEKSSRKEEQHHHHPEELKEMKAAVAEAEEKPAQTAIPIPINAPLAKVQRLDRVGYFHQCLCVVRVVWPGSDARNAITFAFIKRWLLLHRRVHRDPNLVPDTPDREGEPLTAAVAGDRCG